MADNHLEAIREQLVADATVTGLVGSRIYPIEAPQGGPRPLIVLNVISDVPNNALTGDVATRLHSVRVQVDSYAETYREARALHQAAANVLGALATSDLSASLDGAVDSREDQTRLYRTSADYSVSRGPG